MRHQKVQGGAVILTLAAAVLLSVPLAMAEPAHPAQHCDLTGTWYGGSVVAYQLTVTPAAKPGHFTVIFQGMYKNSAMNTAYSGEVARKRDRYEGSLLQLTGDEAFLGPPPLIGKMPDLVVVWTSMKLVDCNTIENTIPFFGTYFASNIWQPGIVWNTPPFAKVPLVDPPDVDLLNILNNGDPVKETYHRLLKTINPTLPHKDSEED